MNMSSAHFRPTESLVVSVLAMINRPAKAQAEPLAALDGCDALYPSSTSTLTLILSEYTTEV